MKYFIDAALQTFAFEDSDTDEFIAQYAQPEWVPVSNIPVDPPKPAIDPITQAVVRDGCEFVDGQWRYKWRVDQLSPEQIEAVRKAAVPASVSPRQIRQALTRIGWRSSVEAAVLAGDHDTKDWWEFATVFERNHPKVVSMGLALNQSPLQMDDLFTLAGTL